MGARRVKAADCEQLSVFRNGGGPSGAAAYKVENNSALSFVEECCVLDEKAECIREELFQQYREYCNKNGLKAMSQANFNKDIEGLGKRVGRGFERVSRRKTWQGIRMA